MQPHPTSCCNKNGAMVSTGPWSPIVDAATLISDGNAKNFEMISFQWSGRPDPDGNTYQFYKTTPGTSFNWSGISNPQIDALLDKSREAICRSRRVRSIPTA